MKGHLDTTVVVILWYEKSMGEPKKLVCCRGQSLGGAASLVMALPLLELYKATLCCCQASALLTV